jgi:hypothetical protein
MRTAATPLVAAAAAALWAAPALAQGGSEIDLLNQAIEAYNENRLQQAASGFYQIEEAGTVEDDRAKAGYYLAQSLSKLGLGFGAFFYYSQIVKAGPTHPFYFKAVEGVLRVTDSYQDEVLGPSVLNRAYSDQFARLPAPVLARINYYIALLGYRAGHYEEAEQFLQGVPAGSSAFAKATYLAGLLAQRSSPEKALGLFRALLQLDEKLYPELPALRELCHLALGRTLYGMHRYREAAKAYAQLPRFSRHWDEALFEGAYADLLADDPGGALGRLHSLHSPHLSDQFAPESENLAAIVYHQLCLWPQAREAVARFDRDYLPMRVALQQQLDRDPPFEALWQLVSGEQAGLPTPVLHHLQKNERIASMLGYVGRLDREAEAIKADSILSKDPLGADLLDLIVRQRALVVQLGGKFIKGRLADLTRLITVLDADKLIISFETTKGEKEFLEGRVDLAARLREQSLQRPPMPETGHEHWPFDGEYWPDEIGYFRYTLKSACPAAGAPGGGGAP